MANYYFSTKFISRGKRGSLTGTASYICGRTLRDPCDGRLRRYKRDDVLYYHIFLPKDAPEDFYDLQCLCNRLEEAELRCDARTARYIIGCLPNELPRYELSRIVREFIQVNFVNCGLCAIAAIHEGNNEAEPQKNNPHAHILVSTRIVDESGLNKEKDREHNKPEYLPAWHREWMLAQNRAYERNGMDIPVSHERRKVQRIRDRKPIKYRGHLEWETEHSETPAQCRQLERELSR